MFGRYRLRRLQLDNDFPLHNQISEIVANQSAVFVENLQRNLLLNFESRLL